MALWFLLLACDNPEPELETFGAFYEDLRDKLCPLATESCIYASEQLDCQFKTSVPACTGYDATVAQLCLDTETTCVDRRLESGRVCDLVCEDTSFEHVGVFPSPPECAAMLACDRSLGALTSFYTPIFQGETDPLYGPDGSCYEGGDIQRCVDACITAIGAMETVVETVLVIGDLSSVPPHCQEAIDFLPSPPTPFEIDIVLTDGDGVLDTAFGDGDSVSVSVAGGADEHPDVVLWLFGFEQTWVIASGVIDYRAEQCASVDDSCHPMPTNDPTLTLSSNRDPEFGVSTSFWVTSPNPNRWFDTSFVVRGVDVFNTEVVCYSQGTGGLFYPGCRSGFITVH